MTLTSHDLDVMAEAYHRALAYLPGDFTEPQVTQTLIEGLTSALSHGVRDEDELAKAALAHIDIDVHAA